MTRMLALSEPRLGHHSLNHARSVIWYLFDEHGEGFYISWVEYLTDTHGPECMAFKARRDKGGDVSVVSWSEEAVSYEPDAALALRNIFLQLTRDHDIRIVVDDDVLALLRQGKVVSDE